MQSQWACALHRQAQKNWQEMGVRRQWMPTASAIKDEKGQPKIDWTKYLDLTLKAATAHGIQMDTDGNLALRIDLDDEEKKEDACVKTIWQFNNVPDWYPIERVLTDISEAGLAGPEHICFKRCGIDSLCHFICGATARNVTLLVSEQTIDG